MAMRRIWLAPLATLALAGCAANPVTGKKELHLVSQEQEIAIGQQQYSPSRQAQGGDYVTDPAVLDYVREVGNKLAAVSDRKLPYEFVVVNDGTLNAWALPGGKIAVNRGLLTELHSEAELAAVLGHEIVHAAARHGAQQMEQSQLMQIGAQIASVAASVYGGGQLGQMVGQGAAIGSQLVTM
jgi:predicted Zn-dependent protease